MYNTIIALGYLVKDPEVKQTSTGKSICVLRMCISESNAKNKCFIDVEAWEKTAEACGKYLKKGREILLEGELCLSTWTAKDGTTQNKNYIRANKVKFIGSSPKDGEGQEDGSKSTATNTKTPLGGSAAKNNSFDDTEEDIPF